MTVVLRARCVRDVSQVSMLDQEIFEAVTKYLNLCDVQRKGYADPNADEFGDVHLVLFGDFKCPPVAQ